MLMLSTTLAVGAEEKNVDVAVYAPPVDTSHVHPVPPVMLAPPVESCFTTRYRLSPFISEAMFKALVEVPCASVTVAFVTFPVAAHAIGEASVSVVNGDPGGDVLIHIVPFEKQ